MAKCKTCNEYYKKSRYNNSNECEDCCYSSDTDFIDEEYEIEMDILLNPSGRTAPKFYEE